MDEIGNVSGGEKQRICLARAILINPPILVLDEATSALDEVNQSIVQEALNKMMEGKTSLVVAHRLSTIKDSDRIIGMENGKVVDNGKHSDLLAKPNGVWRTLWEQQNAEKQSAQAPPPKIPMPTLQRSTSRLGKYDVLRQMLVTLGNTENSEQRREVRSQMKLLIDELEAHTSKTGTDITAASPKSSTVSNWKKLRTAYKEGAFNKESATSQRSTRSGEETSSNRTTGGDTPQRKPSVRTLTLERSTTSESVAA